MGEFCLCHALVFTAQWSKKSFHQIKILAVFQDENKSDLEHVTFKFCFFLKGMLYMLSFLCANLHIGRTVM